MRVGLAVWMWAMCLLACQSPGHSPDSMDAGDGRDTLAPVPVQAPADSGGFSRWLGVSRNVPVSAYFALMDSLVGVARADRTDSLDEYLLALANPRILDTLMSFDYYRRKERGFTDYDQSSLLVLRRGDSIGVPDPLHAARLRGRLSRTVIDVNIPAFRLLILEGDDTLLEAPVRVGRHERRYLAVNRRVTDLRTPVGEGKVVRVSRNPWHVNPRTGERYKGTVRDDGTYTLMPLIPWIEPEIDGRRQGALIHPTTNPSTLGKPYSNGCVGTTEADAWIVYFHAPPGTRVRYRYDLLEVTPGGDTLRYEDVYHLMK